MMNNQMNDQMKNQLWDSRGLSDASGLATELPQSDLRGRMGWRKATAAFTAFVFAWSMCVSPVMAETINLEGGSVEVNTQENTTNWNVTGNPVWNVPEFNVPQNNIYNISGLSQNASLALLVNGGQASNIFGTMNLSNLAFILQNIAGINIGSSAMINLNNASLLASTIPLNLNATDFFARQYAFSGEGGFLTNDGKIVGNNADLVALIANAIENSGTIEVPMGTVALAAGNTVTVGISPDGMVSIGVDEATANTMGLKDQIKNTGTISADGGKVILNAQAMDGLFEKAIHIEKNSNAVTAIKADDGTIQFQSRDDIMNDAVLQAMRGSIVMSTEGSIAVSGAMRAEGGSVSVQAKKDISVNEDTAIQGDATLAAVGNIHISADLSGDGILRLYADAKDLTGAAAGGDGAVRHTAGLVQAGTLYLDGAGQTVLGDLKSVDGIYIGNKTSGHLMDTIAMNGRISGTGRLYLVGDGSTTTLTTDVITEGTPIEYNDSLVLAPASGNRITIATTGGGHIEGADITVNGTIDSQNELVGRDLTFDAGSGIITVTGAVGGIYGLGDLAITMSREGHFSTVNSLTVTNYGSIDSGTFSGDVTNYGGEATLVRIFNSDGTWVLEDSQTIHLLMVGGGGGGDAGGGGAGEFYENESYSIEAGTYGITIGAGGTVGNNGGNTSLGELVTVIGGGAGGWIGMNGADGGSGGGGGQADVTEDPDPTTLGGNSTATIGVGYAGGAAYEWLGGAGGGGGAGGPGASNEYGGYGGSGVVSSISGTEVEYAKGGSGSGYSNPATPNTGSGGDMGYEGAAGILVVEYTGRLGIKGGTFNGSMTNEVGGKVRGGVINGTFTQNDGAGPYAYVWNGNIDGNLNNVANYANGNGLPVSADSFTIDWAQPHVTEPNSGVSNAGTVTLAGGAWVNGGTFNGSVINEYAGWISDGTFNASVVNTGLVSGGTFNDATDNSFFNASTGTVSGGVFYTPNFLNEGTISGGQFNGAVLNDGAISSGIFTGSLIQDAGAGSITGGDFSNLTYLELRYGSSPVWDYDTTVGGVSRITGRSPWGHSAGM